MSLTKFLIRSLTPYLFFILKRILVSSSPLFLCEDERLKQALAYYHFHPALCAHPSILYGTRSIGKNWCGIIKLSILYIKKCIKLGVINGDNGQRLIDELSIQPFFCNGSEFWFDDPDTPLRPYIIPDVIKPSGNTAVYTVLTGDYDSVHEVLYKEDGVDYLLFTNNPRITSKTWTVVFVESELDNITLSREIKMLPHKYLNDEYEHSVYVDANAVIYGEITELTRYLYNGKSMAVSRHSIRTNVKEEIEACVELRGTNRVEAEEQYKTYLREGFKDDKPLLECGILVRRHKDERLKQLMQTWFEEFKMGVKRDQLSLLPCIHRLSYDDYTVMDGNVWHNQFNRITSHRV